MGGQPRPARWSAADGDQRAHAERLVARQRAVQLRRPCPELEATGSPGPGPREREVEPAQRVVPALDSEVVRVLSEVVELDDDAPGRKGHPRGDDAPLACDHLYVCQGLR